MKYTITISGPGGELLAAEEFTIIPDGSPLITVKVNFIGEVYETGRMFRIDPGKIREPLEPTEV